VAGAEEKIKLDRGVININATQHAGNRPTLGLYVLARPAQKLPQGPVLASWFSDVISLSCAIIAAFNYSDFLAFVNVSTV
jgi:hypothetical protein